MDGEPLQDGIESADFSGHPGHVGVMPSGVGRGAVTNPTSTSRVLSVSRVQLATEISSTGADQIAKFFPSGADAFAQRHPYLHIRKR
jgi:hypothetical protein